MIIPFVIVLAVVQKSPMQDRATFWKHLDSLKIGATKAQVKALLGAPDDIRDAKDSAEYTHGSEEVWCYGTDGHLHFPTLGRVYFDERRVSGKSHRVMQMPSKSTINETDLRKNMRFIFNVPNRSGTHLDILDTIRAANSLMPLGQDKAFAVIQEFEAVIGGMGFDQRPYYLLNIMFDLDEKHETIWQPSIGAISPRQPKDGKLFPRYPLLFVDDVPFDGVRGINGSGGIAIEWLESYLHFELKGLKFRRRPLVPPDNPFTAYDHAVNVIERAYESDSESDRQKGKLSDNWAEGLRDRLIYQLLRLIRTAYVPSNELLSSIHVRGTYNPRAVELIRKQVTDLKLRWDVSRQIYVRGDGTYTPDKPVENLAPVRWKKHIDGLVFHVFFQRNSDAISVAEVRLLKKPTVAPHVEFFVLDESTHERLWTEKFEQGWSRIESPELEIPKGHLVSLILKKGKAKFRYGPFKS